MLLMSLNTFHNIRVFVKGLDEGYLRQCGCLVSLMLDAGWLAFV